MGFDPVVPAEAHDPGRVVAPVGPEAFRRVFTPVNLRAEQFGRGGAFGHAGRGRDLRPQAWAVSFLHQRVKAEAQPGLLALALAFLGELCPCIGDAMVNGAAGITVAWFFGPGLKL